VAPVTSRVVVRRAISRLFFSLVVAVTIVIIVALSISVLIGLVRGPHEAAHDLETTIGGYWPVILACILLLTAGLAVVPRPSPTT
jgi:uncharacterized BrkB/YihY/UPF0761 family membrane protein